jgi:hypothetical protein
VSLRPRVLVVIRIGTKTTSDCFVHIAKTMAILLTGVSRFMGFLKAINYMSSILVKGRLKCQTMLLFVMFP